MIRSVVNHVTLLINKIFKFKVYKLKYKITGFKQGIRLQESIKTSPDIDIIVPIIKHS